VHPRNSIIISKAIPKTFDLNPNYRLMALNKSYLDETTDLVTRRFSRIPLSVKLNFKFDELYPFMEYFVKHALEQKLSTIVMERNTSKIVSAVVTLDYNEEGLEPPMFEKLVPVLRLLERMRQKFDAQHPHVPKGSVLHPFLGATDQAHEGKGLIYWSLKQCLETGQECGFKHCVVEATDPASTHICVDKLGFRIDNDVNLVSVDDTWKNVEPKSAQFLVREL
jgi:hypothetical protein